MIKIMKYKERLKKNGSSIAQTACKCAKNNTKQNYFNTILYDEGSRLNL